MAAGQIKIDPLAFSNTWLSQKTISSVFEGLYTKEQAIFKSVTSSWKGSGSDAFTACAKALTQETLTGIFMISSISNQTRSVQTVLTNADNMLASALSKLVKK